MLRRWAECHFGRCYIFSVIVVAFVASLVLLALGIYFTLITRGRVGFKAAGIAMIVLGGLFLLAGVAFVIAIASAAGPN